MVIQLLKRYDFASCDDLDNHKVADAKRLGGRWEIITENPKLYNIYFPQGTMLDTSDFDYYFGKENKFRERFKKLVDEGKAVVVEA